MYIPVGRYATHSYVNREFPFRIGWSKKELMLPLSHWTNILIYNLFLILSSSSSSTHPHAHIHMLQMECWSVETENWDKNVEWVSSVSDSFLFPLLFWISLGSFLHNCSAALLCLAFIITSSPQLIRQQPRTASAFVEITNGFKYQNELRKIINKQIEFYLSLMKMFH